MTELSVLFVNYNSWRVLVAALETLGVNRPTRADGSPMPFEVIVVDNASPEADADARSRVAGLVSEFGGELIMHDQNSGYGPGMNLAYARSSGGWILVSNPDVEFAPDCIDRLLRYHETHADCGAAAPEGFWDRGFGCRLPPNILPTLTDLGRLTLASVSPAWSRRYSRRRTPEAMRVWDAARPIALDMLSGCCFLMQRPFVEQIGLFDERFPLYYEDTDLSMRIRRAGKRVVHVPGAKLVHLYNRSGQTDHDEAMSRYWISRRRYYRKWYGRFGGAVYWLTRWILGTRWAKRRGERSPHPKIHELGASTEPPVIDLPGAPTRYLIEISLDPHFYLAAGVFGDGGSWTPSDALFANFGPATYYFRAVDLSGAGCREIGVYRYTRVFPAEWIDSTGASRTPTAAQGAGND